MEFNADTIKGQWTQIKGSFKEKWGKLTENDLQSFDGNFETLKGKLQSLYGYSKERASTEIDEAIQKMKLVTKDTKASFAGKANSAVDSAEAKVDEATAKVNPSNKNRH